VEKANLVTEIVAQLAMGLGRLEGNHAGVAIEKSEEMDALQASREE
jgi:hypothetical protein